jgi:hypothetical protein
MPNILAAANRTGYPLQAAIESVARAGEATHRCSFLSREHLWHDPDTREPHFIDLVLGGQRVDRLRGIVVRVRLVMECKRLDGYWTFPIPNHPATPPASRIRAYSVSPDHLSKPPSWRTYGFGPERVQHVEYCALSNRSGGSDQQDSRTIEPWATELIASCQALAQQELLSRGSDPDLPTIAYFPVLVTTASLHTLSFDPSTVTLEDGKIPPPPLSAPADVNWVVLSKDLGFEPLGINPLEPGRFSSRPRQHVFVVQAQLIDAFLRSCVGIDYSPSAA